MEGRIAEPPREQPVSYQDLLQIRLKAYRNGNWRILKGFEKALFKASLELARLSARWIKG
jgi:hypothetical protein